MLTNVTIILGEEAAGPHRTPHLSVVLLANAAWVLVPLYILYRMVPSAHPFIRCGTERSETNPGYEGQVGFAGKRAP
jgi:hypothetical protein